MVDEKSRLCNMFNFIEINESHYYENCKCQLCEVKDK